MNAVPESVYQPSFKPSELKGPKAGPPNEVLVLGSPHLAQLEKEPAKEGLERLLKKLAAWGPTAIATESISGVQADYLRRHPGRHESSIARYCWDPTPATRATGIDVPAATAEADQLLQDWPESPDPSQRRHLAAIFLAGGERDSALVQWLQLDSPQRHSDGLLTQDLVELLDKCADQRRGESVALGAQLAARLGLERLWSVDDHSTYMDLPTHKEAAFNSVIQEAWDNPAIRERMAAVEEFHQGVDQPDGPLNLYRACNSHREQQAAFESDFGPAMEHHSPEGYGRMYTGAWETRNLRMVANIREVLTRRPGTRLLAIVGASHKGYYEAYLHQMHDVVLTDALEVLA